jgi:hypothetical protein
VTPVARHFCLLFALSAFAAGCDDLSEFRGKFEGPIVEGKFVRSCFDDAVHATLTFDPDYAVAPLPADLPLSRHNRLTTSDGIFKDTLLEPIAALPHDPLSKFDFPGSRRLRNFMLWARPEAGPLAGRDAMVVVSLLDDERVEVRVMARSAADAPHCRVKPQPVEAGAPEAGTADAGAPDAGESPAGGASTPEINEYFGLFRLKSS